MVTDEDMTTENDEDVVRIIQEQDAPNEIPDVPSNYLKFSLSN